MHDDYIYFILVFILFSSLPSLMFPDDHGVYELVFVDYTSGCILCDIQLLAYSSTMLSWGYKLQQQFSHTGFQEIHNHRPQLLYIFLVVIALQLWGFYIWLKSAQKFFWHWRLQRAEMSFLNSRDARIMLSAYEKQQGSNLELHFCKASTFATELSMKPLNSILNTHTNIYIILIQIKYFK